jgi:hypothetical protein
MTGDDLLSFVSLVFFRPRDVHGALLIIFHYPKPQTILPGIFEDLDPNLTTAHTSTLTSEPSLPSPMGLGGVMAPFGSTLLLSGLATSGAVGGVDAGSKRGRITLYCIAGE